MKLDEQHLVLMAQQTKQRKPSNSTAVAMVREWRQNDTALQFVCRISSAALLVIHGHISDVNGDPPACRFTSRNGDIDLYLDLSTTDITPVDVGKGIGGPLFALIEEGGPLPVDEAVPATVH